MMFLQNSFESASKAHFDAPYILWFLLGKVNNYRFNFLWFSYNFRVDFLWELLKMAKK